MSQITVGHFCGYCSKFIGDKEFISHLNACEIFLCKKSKEMRIDFFKNSMNKLDHVKQKELWQAAKDSYERLINERPF